MFSLDGKLLTLCRVLDGLEMVRGETVGVRGLETLRTLGVTGARDLGTGRVMVEEGGETAVVGGLRKVREDEGDVKVLLCVAEAVVSLSARAYPASVRENLKSHEKYRHC